MTAILQILANHLWQSTLFAVAAALLVRALHQNHAAARHRVWLAASLKFLIPLSPLITFGSHIQWRTEAIPVKPLPAIAMFGEPFHSPIQGTVSANTAAGAPWFQLMLVGIWLIGCAVMMGRWYLRWHTVRAALHSASMLSISGPIPVMCSPARFEPGIFGVFRSVLLLPEGIITRLTPEQLRAILAHEFCHARRRDNIWAATHMIVETLFWFHPIVWWIGARLVDERERACDEAVLRLGNDPAIYASGILDVCRFYLESPLPCASGVTGADLERRIAAIMSRRVFRRLTLARKGVLVCATIAAVTGPIALGMLKAQNHDTLRFEVASIKPANATGRGAMEILPGGGLRMAAVTLNGLIALAYEVRPEEISGGPKWAGSETYAILAKPERADPDDSGPAAVATSPAAWERLRERLRTLLAERFRLVVRTNGKESSGYQLVLAKVGTKLEPTTNPLPPGTVRSFGVINGRSGTMRMLSAVLSNYLGRPVADRTGLNGNYDYKLEYAEDMGPGATPSDTPAASIFTALQEQLGLKLEPSKVTIESIIIERAERPSN